MAVLIVIDDTGHGSRDVIIPVPGTGKALTLVAAKRANVAANTSTFFIISPVLLPAFAERS